MRRFNNLMGFGAAMSRRRQDEVRFRQRLPQRLVLKRNGSTAALSLRKSFPHLRFFAITLNGMPPLDFKSIAFESAAAIDDGIV
jgi:hypothetical protein